MNNAETMVMPRCAKRMSEVTSVTFRLSRRPRALCSAGSDTRRLADGCSAALQVPGVSVDYCFSSSHRDISCGLNSHSISMSP